MILYAITDRTLHPSGDLLAQASSIIRGGVDWLQVREKDLSDRLLFNVLQALAAEARRFRTLLLLNGRPDLAAAAGAGGVHLPAEGLPTREVRRYFMRPFFIVRSCHSTDEVMAAASEGADAVTLGPVFETPSKAGMGEPLGLERFAEAGRRSPIPVIGLGGIDERRIPDVVAAGAAGVAAIRLFASMRNPIEQIPLLRSSLGNTFDHPVVSD
jgi:thiamine-phosphate pyrophosphorylase